jgi:hypothetical protein
MNKTDAKFCYLWQIANVVYSLQRVSFLSAQLDSQLPLQLDGGLKTSFLLMKIQQKLCISLPGIASKLTHAILHALAIFTIHVLNN